MRTIPLMMVLLALGATLARAEPQVRVHSVNGVARLELTEGFPQSYYTVFRGTTPGTVYQPLTTSSVLCLGPCFAEDPEARAGSTYWYRFDFQKSDGSFLTLGPYQVTIPATLARPVGARVFPNPVRGAADIEVHLGGSRGAAPMLAEVCLLDLEGRLVRTLNDGPLPRGFTRLRWDGRDGSGRPVSPGAYFVRVRSPLGETATRLLRVR